jgi:hypothetical protein
MTPAIGGAEQRADILLAPVAGPAPGTVSDNDNDRDDDSCG